VLRIPPRQYLLIAVSAAALVGVAVTSFTSLRGHSYKRAEVDRTSTRSPC